jgi:hypothetical protein
MGLTTGWVARQARVHLQAPRSAAARESMPSQGTVRALPAPQASPPPQPPAPSHPDARASWPMSTPAACGYGRKCHDMALPAAVITDCSLENKCVGRAAGSDGNKAHGKMPSFHRRQRMDRCLRNVRRDATYRGVFPTPMAPPASRFPQAPAAPCVHCSTFVGLRQRPVPAWAAARGGRGGGTLIVGEWAMEG